MLRALIFHIAEHKSLLLAAFISLLVHVFMLGTTSTLLPSASKDLSSMRVQLAQSGKKPDQSSKTQTNLVTPNPIAPDAAVQAAKKEMPITTKTEDAATPEIDEPNSAPYIDDSSSHQVSANTPINESTPELSNADSLTNADSLANANLQAKAQVQTNHAEDSIATPEIDNSANTTSKPYAFVQTEFEVSRGDDTGTLGITQIIFKMDTQKNTYQLTSITEAKGVAALFLGNLEQYSEGLVDEKGLKPTYYAYQYGSNSSKNQYARLSWSDGTIELSSKKGKKSEPLPASTQDFLSFMYQFMFTPPLNTMQLTMTNGKYLRTYVYSFEGEETITTKLGALKTMHLLKSGDSQEKTEIWLASDYQYIPVKIRKTEKNGEVIEQVVTTIKTDNTN